MIRDITIKAALNGFIATVGCQTVVFESLPALLANLEKYIKNPEDTEQIFREHAINSRHTFRNEAVCEVPVRVPQPTVAGCGVSGSGFAILRNRP